MDFSMAFLEYFESRIFLGNAYLKIIYLKIQGLFSNFWRNSNITDRDCEWFVNSIGIVLVFPGSTKSSLLALLPLKFFKGFTCPTYFQAIKVLVTSSKHLQKEIVDQGRVSLCFIISCMLSYFFATIATNLHFSTGFGKYDGILQEK